MDPKEMQKLLADSKATVDTMTVTLKETVAAKTAVEGQVSALTLQLAEKAAKVTEHETELVTLRAEKAEREEAALAATVEEAFLTWKDKKGLNAELKPHMLKHLKSDPVGFKALYPVIEADKRHLLRDLTGARPAGTAATHVDDGQNQVTLNLSDLALQYARKNGVSLETAQRSVLLTMSKSG